MSEEKILKGIDETLKVLDCRSFYEYVGDGQHYREFIVGLLELYTKEKEKHKNTGKLVKNKIDGTIGVVLREWETGQIQVLEKIQPEVINTHDSWKTLEVIEDE